MTSDRTLFTSESVTEGHPDKLCDQISDGMLDECLRQDPNARVACETATTTGTILVCGEITTTAWVDVPALVRAIVKDIGYINADYGFDYQSCGVLTAIKEQSREIAQGVNKSLEARAGTDPQELGAGDQGMMFGFAVRETDELMPLPITLAHAVAKELAAARKSKRLPWLRPDGKSQVTVEYSRGVPQRVHTVVVAAQHDPGIAHDRIEAEIRDVVVKAAIPARWLDAKTKSRSSISRFSSYRSLGRIGWRTRSMMSGLIRSSELIPSECCVETSTRSISTGCCRPFSSIS